MEDKFIYRVFVFTLDGLSRYGLFLVAANNEKEAFEYLMTTRYARIYQISFEKEAVDICHLSSSEIEDGGKIVFKNWIEI